MLHLIFNAAFLLCGVALGLDSSGSSSLQPEVVAHLLSEVEAEWVDDALKVIENQGDSGEYEKMRKSCSKVSSSVVSASDGEKDRVTEYMSDVCSAMHNKDSVICTSFGNRLTSFMSPDASMNRDGSVDLKRFCKVLYRDVMAFAKEKQQEIDAEREAQAKLAAEQAEAERKRKEEEAKKQAEALEVQKVREAETQARAEAEAQRKVEEEQKAAEEEKQAAEERKANQKLLPKVWQQQPDRFMDRLQAKTQAAVKAQVKREQKLQAAYFAKQKAKAQRQEPVHLLPVLPASVSSMGL